jgi:chemotaxis response regulator CheB
MMQKGSFYIAGLGASAGGQAALEEFFEQMPPDTGVAFVVVTHLLRGHRSILDKILQRSSALPVQRMKGYDIVQPDRVYVLPEDAKVYIKNGCLILKPRGEEENGNKTIDLFFHSLAEDQREKAIGIVFSGMGTDGSKGVQTIHEFGGKVFVQEPHSTLFSSMPDAAIRRDSPDKILKPACLADYLVEAVKADKVSIRQSRGSIST